MPPHAILAWVVLVHGRILSARTARRDSTLQSVRHWRPLRVPRALLPLAAALRPRRTACDTRRIRRTARRQREATGGRSFGRLSGPLPHRHRAYRTRAALAFSARRRTTRSVLRRQAAGRSGHYLGCAGGSVVHDDWRPPAARPPTHSPRRPTRHIPLVFRGGDAVCVGLHI